ncbi:MAG: RbsD/FucU domain-containing protein [Bacillota bacterium]|nr:RbsD/FucU domain-containing protein [Bacillota bacterium]
MKKTGVLNAELMAALTKARHKDAIVIVDAGMPVPACANLVDISFIRGVPSLTDTLRGVLSEVVVESVAYYEPMARYNPALLECLQGIFRRQKVEPVSSADFKKICENAIVVVRTAEYGACSNLILYSASGLDEFYDKYNIDPTEIPG